MGESPLFTDASQLGDIRKDERKDSESSESEGKSTSKHAAFYVLLV